MAKHPDHRTQYRLIAQAAELLLKCAGFLDDSNAAVRSDDRHCDTYYAIDTDVITLYLEPEERTHYLDVFGDDPNSSTGRSLAFLLGDFLMNSSDPLLFRYNNHKCRFLLIPPHDEELIRMLTAIHRQLRSVATELDGEVFQKLSSLFDAYETNRDDEQLLREIRRCVPDLVQLFNPYRGPKAALTRYALLPETTFERIETYLEDEFTFPVLDPIHDIKDRQTADELIEQWLTRLRRRKVRHKPAYALQRDAEVLATLEYVNVNLRGSGRQVVLVTGSKHVFEAADEYVPGEDSSRTFADMYLRHPQAFLAHPEFFSLPSTSALHSPPSTENAPFKLIDWLNLIFPTELRPSEQPYGIVRRNFLRNIRSEPDRSLSIVNAFLSRSDRGTQPIETLLKRWNTVIASAAQARYADGLDLAEARGAKELAKTLVALRNRGDWSVDKFRHLLQKESLGSISGLYSTTVWIGLWSKASQDQSKGVPALRFDDHFKEIEDYCDAVVRLQLESASKLLPIPLERLEKLQELNTKVVQSDPSLYDAHLVHALAFATKGHWYATLTLANTAMAICDQMDPATRGPRRGREAAYLACIATRRSAKNRSALEDAHRYLNEAINRETEGAQEDIRFTAERLALETRSHYFDNFCDHKDPKIQAVMTTLNSLHGLVKDAEKEKVQRVKHWVLRQTLTNFFTLLLLVRDVRHSKEVFQREDISKDLQIFQAVLADADTYGYKPDDDPYAHLVCGISTAVWDSDSAKRKNAKTAAVHAVSKYDADFMPYDIERRKFLERSIPE